MTEIDVLVVGGGPGGVISAYTAAKRGHSVVLIDPKPRNEIGNKTCGDALDLAPCKFIKEKLGLEFPNGKEISDYVKTLVFQAGKVEFPIDGEGFIVNRHIYGQRLLDEAEKEGVEIKDGIKAIIALTEGNNVKGARVRDMNSGKTIDFRAKITIDCSGYKAIIRTSLSKDKFPLLEHQMYDKDVMASYREIIKFKDGVPNHNYRNKIYLIYMKEIPAPGYFWVFTEGDNRLNTGICFFKDAQIQDSMRLLYKKILHRDYYNSNQYEVIHGKGYQIPTRYPLLNAVANGFLTAGDAAHHVDPFTAEGHGPALIAGYYAGFYAAKAIESNDFSETNLWPYNKAIIDHFGYQQCKTQVFTEALRKIGIGGLEFLFNRNILSKEEFLDLNKGIRPNVSVLMGKLLKMFPKYSFLPIIYKVARSTSQIKDLYQQYPLNSEDFYDWNEKFLLIMNRIRK